MVTSVGSSCLKLHIVYHSTASNTYQFILFLSVGEGEEVIQGDPSYPNLPWKDGYIPESSASLVLPSVYTLMCAAICSLCNTLNA